MTNSPEPVLMAVGFAPMTLTLLPRDRASRTVILPFRGLTVEALGRHDPAEVMTPLVGQGCDAGQVAQILVACGFRGSLRVICPALPDSAMVRRELAAMAPGLRIDLILPV